ncbi:hypothetical protein Avbf_06137 [Armadillidium vulgare]|nr:hypothetical protein Avbf_06137 [Armadillidium vulgare]
MIFKIVLVCLICAVNARPGQITLSELIRNSSYTSDGQNVTLFDFSTTKSPLDSSSENHESQNLFVKQKRQDGGGGDGGGGDGGGGDGGGGDGSGGDGGDGDAGDAGDAGGDGDAGDAGDAGGDGDAGDVGGDGGESGYAGDAGEAGESGDTGEGGEGEGGDEGDEGSEGGENENGGGIEGDASSSIGLGSPLFGIGDSSGGEGVSTSDSGNANEDITGAVFEDIPFQNEPPLVIPPESQFEGIIPETNEYQNNFGGNSQTGQEIYQQKEYDNSDRIEDSFPGEVQLTPITVPNVDSQNDPPIPPQESQFQPCQTENPESCKYLHNLGKRDSPQPSGEFTLTSFTRPEHEETAQENAEIGYNPIKLFPAYSQNVSNQQTEAYEQKGNSEIYQNRDILQPSPHEEIIDIKTTHQIIPGNDEFGNVNEKSILTQTPEQRAFKIDEEDSKVTFITIAPEELEIDESSYFESEPEDGETVVEYVEEVYLEPIDAESAQIKAEEGSVGKHTVIVKENGEVIVNATNIKNGLRTSSPIEKDATVPEDGDIVEVIQEVPVNNTALPDESTIQNQNISYTNNEQNSNSHSDSSDINYEEVSDIDTNNENSANSQNTAQDQNIPYNTHAFDQTSTSHFESSDISSNAETSNLNTYNAKEKQNTFEVITSTEPEEEYYESEYEDENNNPDDFENHHEQSGLTKRAVKENIDSSNVEDKIALGENDDDEEDDEDDEREDTIFEHNNTHDDDDDTEDTIFGYNSTQTFFYAGGKERKLNKRDSPYYENSTLIEDGEKSYEKVENFDSDDSEKTKVLNSSKGTQAEIIPLFKHDSIYLFYTFFLNPDKSKRQDNNEHVDQPINDQTVTEYPFSLDQESDNNSLNQKRQADSVEVPRVEEGTEDPLLNSSSDQEYYHEHENNQQKRQVFLPFNETETTTESLFIFENSESKSLIPDRKKRQSEEIENPHSEETTEESSFDVTNSEQQNRESEEPDVSQNDYTTTEGLYYLDHDLNNKYHHLDRRRRQSDFVGAPQVEETTVEALFQDAKDETSYPESENSEKIPLDISKEVYETTESSDSLEDDSNNGYPKSDRKRRQADIKEVPPVEEKVIGALFHVTTDGTLNPESENTERASFSASQEDYMTTESSNSFKNDSSNEHQLVRKRRQNGFVDATLTEGKGIESLFNDTTDETPSSDSKNSENVTFDVSQEDYATTESSDFSHHDLNKTSDRRRRQADLAVSPYVEETTAESLFNSSNNEEYYNEHQKSKEKRQVSPIDEPEITTENVPLLEENSQREYVAHNRRKRQSGKIKAQDSNETTEDPLPVFTTEKEFEIDDDNKERRDIKNTEPPTVTTTEEYYYEHQKSNEKRQVSPIDEPEITTENVPLLEENSQREYVAHNRRKRQSGKIKAQDSNETTEDPLPVFTTEKEFEIDDDNKERRDIKNTEPPTVTTTEEYYYEHQKSNEKRQVSPIDEPEITTENVPLLEENSQREYVAHNRRKRQSGKIKAQDSNETTEDPLPAFTTEKEFEIDDDNKERRNLKSTELPTITTAEEYYYEHQKSNEKRQVVPIDEPEITTENAPLLEENSQHEYVAHNRKKRQSAKIKAQDTNETTEDPLPAFTTEKVFEIDDDNKERRDLKSTEPPTETTTEEYYYEHQKSNEKRQVVPIDEPEITTENVPLLEENSQHEYVAHNRKKRQSGKIKAQDSNETTENPLPAFTTEKEFEIDDDNKERRDLKNTEPTTVTTTENILDETTTTKA